LFERADNAKGLVRAPAGRGLDAQDACAADRERPRLVENRRARPRQRLEREASFHQDAAPRRARNACDIGYGRGKDQRTGRRRHEDREDADRVAGKGPRSAGEGKRRW
jgi:hypothetical protein